MLFICSLSLINTHTQTQKQPHTYTQRYPYTHTQAGIGNRLACQVLIFALYSKKYQEKIYNISLFKIKKKIIIFQFKTL